MSKDKTIDLLRKLLAHQKSAVQLGNQAEAEAFAGRIQELLTKHSIDVAELAERETDAHNVTKVVGVVNGVYKSRAILWEGQLLNVVAKYNFCRVVRNHGNEYAIIGHPDDIEVVSEMFNFLHDTVERLSEKEFNAFYGTANWYEFLRKQATSPTWASRLWRDSYQTGFVSGIHNRLRERNKIALEGAPQNAMVLLTNKMQRTEQAMSKFYTRLKDGPKSQRRIDAKAYYQGYDAGKQATVSGRDQLGE